MEMAAARVDPFRERTGRIESVSEAAARELTF